MYNLTGHKYASTEDISSPRHIFEKHQGPACKNGAVILQIF